MNREGARNAKKLKKVEPRRHKGREGGEVLNREGAKYAKEVVL